MKIYTAHQITGLSYDEVMNYYAVLQDKLEFMGYDVLCPMVAKGYLKDQMSLKSDGYQFPASTNHAIFERDKWMVAQADVVLCIVGFACVAIFLILAMSALGRFANPDLYAIKMLLALVGVR